MDGILKRYILWTYCLFYSFLLIIGITMFIFKSEATAAILIVLSSWTSTIIFIIMFRKIYPQNNLWDFVKSQFCERVKVSIVFYVLLIQLLVLIATLIITSTVWNVPIQEQLTASKTTLLMLFGYNLIQGPLGEEIGWRGFILNELQKKFSPLKSTMIVGVAWGFWHTPLWFMSGYSGLQLEQYIVCFMVGIIAVSIIITAFYNLNHNLIIPVIIHQFFNYFLAIQVGEMLHILTITALFYLIVALMIVLVNYKNCLYERKV